MESVSLAARQSLVLFFFLTNPRVYLGVRLAWLGRVGSFCWWCTEATASSPFWGRENVVGVLRQGNGTVHCNCPLDISYGCGIGHCSFVMKNFHGGCRQVVCPCVMSGNTLHLFCCSQGFLFLSSSQGAATCANDVCKFLLRTCCCIIE